MSTPLRRSPRKRTVVKADPDPVPSSCSSATTKKKRRTAQQKEPSPENAVSSHPPLAVSSQNPHRTTSNNLPSHDECRYVVESLGKLHSDVLDDCRNRRSGSLGSSCGMKDSIADGLVSTILSQNTTNANSTKAFQQLKKALPTWEDVVALPDPPTKLENAIRCGGLAQIKSQRIQKIFTTLVKERGSPSLEYLRDLTNEEIKQELGRFPGLGPKTISCILLFTLLRPDFAVDTHVHRICRDVLKWIPPKTNREQAYEQLNAPGVIPDEVKLELHCLLIAHGRQCHKCAARGKPQFPPKDGTKLKCPLVGIGRGLLLRNSKRKVAAKEESTAHNDAEVKPEPVLGSLA